MVAGRSARRPVLLRRSVLGSFEAPRPLPAPDALMRWARPLLLPFSSVMRAEVTEPVLSLTYDDGPNPHQTPALLDVLAERGARATFFLLTEAAERSPQLVRRMLADGHEVGLHGVDHTRLTSVPAREAIRRLRTGKRRLEAVTGVPVRYYRPTYGALGLAAFVGARSVGLRPVIWSAWARDWEDAPADVVVARAVAALHRGAIVLLHDDTDDEEARAAGALPAFSRADVTRRVLDGMAEQGLTSMPVGELLARHRAVRSVTLELPWRSASG